MITVLSFIFGSLIGSFLNVCIHRLPKGESIVFPASRCPVCQTPIRPWDNIPVISFALLGGRCRACRSPISWRYPLVEALTGTLFAATVAQFGLTIRAAFLVAFLAGLVVISFIDLDHQIIPNAITLPGIPLGLVAGFIAGGPPVVDRLIGALAGAGFLYLVLLYGGAAFGRDAMGEGDLDLIALVGAFLGWQAVIVTILVGCLTGSVVGVTLIACKRLGRRQPIPFGPYLSIGAVVAVFYGPRLINWYLTFLK